MEPIRIIAAGGTIDAKDYDFAMGRVVAFGDPAVEKIFASGRVRTVFTKTERPVDENADILVLEQKDSLDMTEDDRLRILLLCLLDSRERILITHGTDTMVNTGLLLQKHVEGKTIVLTGAMRPNTAVETDAPFNVGGALVACQTLPHGVYVVMQGRVFPVNQVRKIRVNGSGYFQKVSSDKKHDRDTAREFPQTAAKIKKKTLFSAHRACIVLQLPLEARISTEKNNTPAGTKEAFYMAGYPDGSRERYLGPMNHTYMFVVDGSRFGIDGDVLIGTGNAIINLKPFVLRILQMGLNDIWTIVVGEELDGFGTLRVLFETNIIKDYSQQKWMRGLFLHTRESFLKPPWNALKK